MTQHFSHPSVAQAEFTALLTELRTLCARYEIPTPSLRMSPHLQKANGICQVKIKRSGRGQRIYDLSSIEIVLATRALQMFGLDRLILTLRHEVAHAVCLIKYNDFSHSDTFKQICVEMGGSMNAALAGETYAVAASAEFIKPTSNWRYTCPGCNHSFERRSRLPHAALAGRQCSKDKTPLTKWHLRRL